MAPGLHYPLLLLGLAVLLRSPEGGLLDIYGPVNVMSSSTYRHAGAVFHPQLAIQADTSHECASCFISKNESNSWFTLQFKSVTSIQNIRLVVRTETSSGLPIDYTQRGMEGLYMFVYVSNSSVVGSSDQRLCRQWEYRNARDIVLRCRKGLKGQFVHIAVSSTSPAILIICGIVVNREPGPRSPMNLLQERATVVSSGFEIGRPPTLAIDGNTSHNKKLCAALFGAGTATAIETWLQIDMQTVWYIQKVVLLFPSHKEKRPGVTVSIGQGLRDKGVMDNTQCVAMKNNILGDHRIYFECNLPVLGQFIYINTPDRSLEICEIEVFCDNFLNIYSRVSIIASDQRTAFDAIWKPNDFVHTPSLRQGAWESFQSARSWWRMEFPRKCAIFAVEITCSAHCKRLLMAGPAVYVGDSVIVSSRSNVKCGKPLLTRSTSTMMFKCLDVLIGKYIYIVTAGRPEAQLFMSNIAVYGYEGLHGIYIGESETELVVKARTFTVTWPNPVDRFNPIILFGLSYRKEDSSNFTSLGFVRATTKYSTVSVQQLQPYTRYIFKIIPLTKTGALEMESVMHITTAVSFPSAPRKPTVIVDSETTLVATWIKPKAPNGPIDSYNVYLHKIEGEHKRSPSVSRVSTVGSVTSIRISGLEKHSIYTMTVSAVNIGTGGKRLEGQSSSIIEISRLENQSSSIVGTQGAPLPPLNVIITTINETSLNVSWEPSASANGTLQFYEVLYDESTKFDINGLPRNVTVHASELSVVLTGLSRGINYSIAVRVATIHHGKLSVPSYGTGTTLVDNVMLSPEPVVISKDPVPTSANRSVPSSPTQSVPVSVNQSALLFSSQPALLSSTLSVPLSSSQSASVSSSRSVLFPSSQSASVSSSQSGPFPSNQSTPSSSQYAPFSTDQPAPFPSIPFSSSQSTSLSSNQPAPFSSGPTSRLSSNESVHIPFSESKAKQSSSRQSELITSSQQLLTSSQSETFLSSQPVPLTSSHTQELPSLILRHSENGGSGFLSIAVAVAVAGISLVVVIIVVLIVRRRRSRVDEIVPNSPGGRRETRQSELARPSVVGIDYNLEEKLSPLVVGDFETYVQEMHSNDNRGFSLEFTLLNRESCSDQPTTAAMMKCNKARNNYEDVLPFDHNRVVLKQLAGIPGSDYVNASYVNAYGHPKGYIAAQGPNGRTINDFWRMIWQENVRTIVMVTNLEEEGEELCSCYWPSLQGDDEYGSVTVSFSEEFVLSEVTKRVFQVKHCEEDESKSRVVTQFQFTGWRYDDVPSYTFSFLKFVQRVRTYHDGLETSHPMVVHCSDGAGQTGTFITSDYTIQKLKRERKVDIFELIKELRLQRISLVETKEQYIFCHDFALVFMLCGNTSVPVNQLGEYILRLHEADPLTEKTGFDTHFELLNKLTPIYDHSSNSTFIAATTVHGYRQKNMYITTQVPNEYTAEDFWSLLWDQNIMFIVTLTRQEENGEETPLQYWPSEDTTEYDSMSVALQEEEKLEEYAIRKFKLTDKQSSNERVITQFVYLAWSDGKVPETCCQLLEMLNRIEAGQQQVDNKSVVVTCSDGVHKSGLFCAVSIIVEALKTEQVVDVFKTIQALRLHNADFVSDQEEYRFCYDLALKCVNSLRTKAI